ncbi:histidinol dehydrogenase [Aciditerrimonas ferrireducens]|uniref:Histidinol dehydrogenase n=1 Tax=Aciditerrimonas ferrireducens TaxID=667306 RepID=A0ABV6C378_9ACTN
MLLDRLDLRGLAPTAVAGALPLPAFEEQAPSQAVAEILGQVRRDGDQALRRLTARFDGVELDDLRVPPADLEAALAAVPPELRQALEVAWERIVAYHRHQLQPETTVEVEGVVVRHLARPVGRVGVYAPGGRARYPSSVLMGVAPARVAGVEEIVLCAPPQRDGSVALETLAAAAVCGVQEVYRVGGAQAVAALAYGTESIRPVDVIVGPGNSYVAEAKRQVAGRVGIPAGFAGPSEVVVVADASVPATWAAIDVLVQAEHGPDGLAWLVTTDDQVAERVAAEVDRLVAASPRRDDLASTLARSGYAVVVDDAEAVAAVVNTVAPEHLELLVAEPQPILERVRAAGAIFVGPYAPASVGDYVAGPNHVLPTARTARFSSALRVQDFQVQLHAVEVPAEALAALGPHVVALADAEGLPAHADSVRLRLADPDRPGGE